jgi:hypothetical protein
VCIWINSTMAGAQHFPKNYWYKHCFPCIQFLLKTNSALLHTAAILSHTVENNLPPITLPAPTRCHLTPCCLTRALFVPYYPACSYPLPPDHLLSYPHPPCPLLPWLFLPTADLPTAPWPHATLPTSPNPFAMFCITLWLRL